MQKQEIQSAVTSAMKSGDKVSVETLRMLLSSINAKEKERRYALAKEKPDASEEDLHKLSESSEEQITQTVFSEIKKRNDAIALYTQGNRPELAAKEQEEIEVLKKFLPEQLSEEKLKTLIIESIATTGAREIKEMGKVLGDLTPKVKGKADMAQVSRMVKELLTK